MAQTHSYLWPGVPLALLSAVLFGATAPLAKLLLVAASPQLLAGLLYLGAGLGLALAQGGRVALGVPASEAPLRRHDLPWLAAIVLCGGLAGPLLLMLGLARTSAAMARRSLHPRRPSISGARRHRDRTRHEGVGDDEDAPFVRTALA